MKKMEGGVVIVAEAGSFEKAIKRFRQLSQPIVAEARRRERYIPPSQRRREAVRAAQRKIRQAQPDEGEIDELKRGGA